MIIKDGSILAKEYLLVDGYNIIFSWKELFELAEVNLEAARQKLADTLCNYQGFKKNEIILIFDGYKSKGNLGSVIHYHNIDIVYTKEAETADQFIEMVAQKLARRFLIRVATSDAIEQIIILGKGAIRMSARELQIEIRETEQIIRETYLEKNQKGQNNFIDNLSPDMAKMLEEMRLKED
jgi:uncharacterized protein